MRTHQQAPVRKAVLKLAAQGLLDVRPRKGMRILPISTTDMCEICVVLTELESMAAASAARTAQTPETLADNRFHTELVRFGGSSHLVMIVGMMGDQVRRARSVTLYLRTIPTKSNADRRGVLNAIRNGGAAKAARIHRAHPISAKEMLLDRHRLQHL